MKKKERMQAKYGTVNNVCDRCSHLKRVTFRGRRYAKCEIYGTSNSSATDWSATWMACGMFNVPVDMETFTPMFRAAEPRMRQGDREQPISGQIDIFEAMAQESE